MRGMWENVGLAAGDRVDLLSKIVEDVKRRINK